ncbi:LysE family transporter [Pelagibacterales bacterium SAG-MED34]|nr:LysE family transporter [Pelagibacterales bacterium SAG-MED34]
MSYLFFGFLTGLSLILAIGAQNIFVIEQGLKKKHIFIVCLICSISDFILIFLGIFLFHYFQNFFSPLIELILNLLLLLFLINFIWRKLKSIKSQILINDNSSDNTFISVVVKTLGFTYLNPHVYSDTVFFLGNFSKDFLITQKYYFGIGASLSSFLFFFILGYLSKFLSNYIDSKRIWIIINYSIVFFMSLLSVYVLMSILK